MAQVRFPWRHLGMEALQRLSRNLKANVLAATHALQDGEAGGGTHALVSRTQRLALLDLIRREKSSLTTQSVADLWVVVSRMRWADEDLACLQAEVMDERTNSNRRDVQDYLAVLHYFPQVFWQRVRFPLGKRKLSGNMCVFL